MAEEMTEMFSASVQSEPEEVPKKQLSLTEVRAVLAEKSRAGFTKEVKELLICCPEIEVYRDKILWFKAEK